MSRRLNQHQLSYHKRTEIAVEIVRQIEGEGFYPQVDYAFDQGVLSHPLTTLIESSGKHWVSEIEKTRLILWNGHGQKSERFNFAHSMSSPLDNGSTLFLVKQSSKWLSLHSPCSIKENLSPKSWRC